MTPTDRRRDKYEHLQEELFAAWAALKARIVTSAEEYNTRRARVIESLNEEGKALQAAIERCQGSLVSLEKKKLNLEATFLHHHLPYPESTASVEEVVAAAKAALESLGPVATVTSGDVGYENGEDPIDLDEDLN